MLRPNRGLTLVSRCRWIFPVQTCPLELHCFPDQWVGCYRFTSTLNNLEIFLQGFEIDHLESQANLWRHCISPSFSLLLSLWCRGVTENFRFGASGLFQLRVESVSKNWMWDQAKPLYRSDRKLWDFLTVTESYKIWIRSPWLLKCLLLKLFTCCALLSRFDFSVTVFAFLGLIATAFDMEPFYFIVVLRPLQLLRYVLLSVKWTQRSYWQ